MNNKTELVFLLDRSGSMSGLEADTIGGFNSLVEKQKKAPGKCCVTTVLFDDQYELLYDRLPLQSLAPMTNRQYYVRGCTALLDAIGRTVCRIAEVQKLSRPEDRADRVLFVITTDGMENASREYNAQLIRKMITTQQHAYGWEFLFLGANIDAIATAARFGIRRDRAVNYHPDPEGTRLNYEAVNDAVSCIRASTPLQADWKKNIEQDFKTRLAKR